MGIMMITEKAYAKINLTLSVGEKREDGYCPTLNSMLAQPEQYRCVRNAEFGCDFSSAALLENVVLDEPIFLTKDDMLAPVLALLKLS